MEREKLKCILTQCVYHSEEKSDNNCRTWKEVCFCEEGPHLSTGICGVCRNFWQVCTCVPVTMEMQYGQF